jgi:hypothetical protein
MEYHRKQAKALVRAFRAGEVEAVARAEAVLGERARERFGLSDAQHVVAREQGHRSWTALKRSEAPEEHIIDSGLSYTEDQPIRIRVRRRGHRYVIDDGGTAAELAGRPPGWLKVAERVVDEFWLNVNRRGVVFVPAVAGGVDRAWLVRRVAETSAALYAELLELRGQYDPA